MSMFDYQDFNTSELKTMIAEAKAMADYTNSKSYFYLPGGKVLNFISRVGGDVLANNYELKTPDGWVELGARDLGLPDDAVDRFGYFRLGSPVTGEMFKNSGEQLRLFVRIEVRNGHGQAKPTFWIPKGFSDFPQAANFLAASKRLQAASAKKAMNSAMGKSTSASTSRNPSLSSNHPNGRTNAPDGQNPKESPESPGEGEDGNLVAESHPGFHDTHRGVARLLGGEPSQDTFGMFSMSVAMPVPKLKIDSYSMNPAPIFPFWGADDPHVMKACVAWAGTNDPLDVFDYSALASRQRMIPIMEPVLDKFREYLIAKGIKPNEVIITGYSLGGGLTNVMAEYRKEMARGYYDKSRYVAFASPIIYDDKKTILNIGYENDVVFRSIGGAVTLDEAVEKSQGFYGNADEDHNTGTNNMVLFNGVYGTVIWESLPFSILNLPFSWSTHFEGTRSDAINRILSSRYSKFTRRNDVVVVSALKRSSRAWRWVEDIPTKTSNHHGMGAFIFGTRHDDLLKGGLHGDHIDGFEGNDKIRPMWGANDVDGGEGDDSLVLEGSADEWWFSGRWVCDSDSDAAKESQKNGSSLRGDVGGDGIGAGSSADFGAGSSSGAMAGSGSLESSKGESDNLQGLSHASSHGGKSQAAIDDDAANAKIIAEKRKAGIAKKARRLVNEPFPHGDFTRKRGKPSPKRKLAPGDNAGDSGESRESRGFKLFGGGKKSGGGNPNWHNLPTDSSNVPASCPRDKLSFVLEATRRDGRSLVIARNFEKIIFMGNGIAPDPALPIPFDKIAGAANMVAPQKNDGAGESALLHGLKKLKSEYLTLHAKKIEALEKSIRFSRHGTDGDDDMTGGRLFLGAGNDIGHGVGPEAILHGGEGDDILVSSDDESHLYGAEGDDMLVAKGGSTRMEGGMGNDIFVIGADSKLAIIADFMDTPEDMDSIYIDSALCPDFETLMEAANWHSGGVEFRLLDKSIVIEGVDRNTMRRLKEADRVRFF